MSLISRKIAAFAKKVASLPPKPGGTMPVADLQAQFDAAPEELKAALNGAIDDIIADYATKSELNGLVLGQVPNGSITEPKLDTALAQKVNGGLVNFLSRQAAINGNFDIVTRGTLFTNPVSGAYLLDRWKLQQGPDGGTFPTINISQQPITSGDVPGSYYCMRLNANGAGAALGPGSTYLIYQKIENGTKFLAGAGKKVTVTFKARSSIANKRIGIYSAQRYGTGGAPSTAQFFAGTNFTLSPTWTTYTYTFTTNSLTGKVFGTNNDDYLEIVFGYQWGSSSNGQFGATVAETFVGAGDVDITQVQVCAGDTALPFQPRSYDEEFRLCGRYCRSITDPTNANFTVGVAQPGSVSTTANIFLPIDGMRTPPTLIATPADWQLYSISGATSAAVTALSIASGMSNNQLVVLSATSAGNPSSGSNMVLRSVAAGRSIIFDAEL